MAERSAYRLRTPVLYPRLIGPGGAAEAAQARVYDDFANYKLNTEIIVYQHTDTLI